MSQATSNQHDPDMLDEYDFSEGVRGKYAERYPTKNTEIYTIAKIRVLRVLRVIRDSDENINTTRP